MFEVGDQISNWVLGRQLGAGGMGSVFAARDAMIPEEIAAIKVLAASATDRAARSG